MKTAQLLNGFARARLFPDCLLPTRVRVTLTQTSKHGNNLAGTLQTFAVCYFTGAPASFPFFETNRKTNEIKKAIIRANNAIASVRAKPKIA